MQFRVLGLVLVLAMVGCGAETSSSPASSAGLRPRLTVLEDACVQAFSALTEEGLLPTNGDNEPNSLALTEGHESQGPIAAASSTLATLFSDLVLNPSVQSWLVDLGAVSKEQSSNLSKCSWITKIGMTLQELANALRPRSQVGYNETYIKGPTTSAGWPEKRSGNNSGGNPNPFRSQWPERHQWD